MEIDTACYSLPPTINNLAHIWQTDSSVLSPIISDHTPLYSNNNNIKSRQIVRIGNKSNFFQSGNEDGMFKLEKSHDTINANLNTNDVIFKHDHHEGESLVLSNTEPISQNILTSSSPEKLYKQCANCCHYNDKMNNWCCECGTALIGITSKCYRPNTATNQTRTQTTQPIDAKFIRTVSEILSDFSHYLSDEFLDNSLELTFPEVSMSYDSNKKIHGLSVPLSSITHQPVVIEGRPYERRWAKSGSYKWRKPTSSNLYAINRNSYENIKLKEGLNSYKCKKNIDSIENTDAKISSIMNNKNTNNNNSNLGDEASDLESKKNRSMSDKRSTNKSQKVYKPQLNSHLVNLFN